MKIFSDPDILEIVNIMVIESYSNHVKIKN